MKKTAIILALACAIGAQAQTTLKADVSQSEATETQKWTVNLTLETSVTDFAALQMRVTTPSQFPNNTRIEAGTPLGNHTLTTNTVSAIDPFGDNYDMALEHPDYSMVTTALAYSTSGAVFALDGTPLLTVTIEQDGDQAIEAGEYSLNLTDIRLARADGNETTLKDQQLTLTVLEDGVAAVRVLPVNADVYTPDGRLYRRATRVADLPAGMYIINGHKVVKR